MTPPLPLRYRNGRMKDLSPLPPPKSGGKFKAPGSLRSSTGSKHSKPVRGSLGKWTREAGVERGAKTS